MFVSPSLWCIVTSCIKSVFVVTQVKLKSIIRSGFNFCALLETSGSFNPVFGLEMQHVEDGSWKEPVAFCALLFSERNWHAICALVKR
jgi:hypothetical protein